MQHLTMHTNLTDKYIGPNQFQHLFYLRNQCFWNRLSTEFKLCESQMYHRYIIQKWISKHLTERFIIVLLINSHKKKSLNIHKCAASLYIHVWLVIMIMCPICATNKPTAKSQHLTRLWLTFSEMIHCTLTLTTNQIYFCLQRYYIVGSNSTETRFRVMKIDRTESKGLVIHDEKVN